MGAYSNWEADYEREEAYRDEVRAGVNEWQRPPSLEVKVYTIGDESVYRWECSCGAHGSAFDGTAGEARRYGNRHMQREHPE